MPKSFHNTFDTLPRREHYDAVIIGGATSGCSTAWHLAKDPEFSGSILVIERDPTLTYSATNASNNCMRQHFATEINVKIAQYAAEFVKLHGDQFPVDENCVPNGGIRNFGYLYLSDSPRFTSVLENDQQLQARCGAGTQMISRSKIEELHLFFATQDIDAGSLNTKDEGAFNELGMVEWLRSDACRKGVEYINNEVTRMDVNEGRIRSIVLGSGEKITAGNVVNSAGTRAAVVSRLAGCDLPIEARRRYTYIFSVEKPLQQDLPLTIDPSGVHLPSYGVNDYLVGCPPIGSDDAVDVNDFEFAEDAWTDKVKPILERRIPQFSSARVADSWIGHYEFNSFDRNAIVGAHDVVKNLYFCVGFSGHGSQQAPACGRALAELIVHGQFETLDLSALSYTRIPEGRPLMERAVI